MRGEPYTYQVGLLDQLWAERHSKTPTVLAAGCGAGKTFMSIHFLENYLQENPDVKVLVLAHAQEILRSQYSAELRLLQPSFSWCTVTTGAGLADDYQRHSVLVTLPQTLQSRKIPKFDLIIVDEAHLFYFAPTVEGIIRRAKPKHQVLLTGTPSPFIRRNNEKAGSYHLISMPQDELLEAGAINDLVIENATTTYDITERDYNREGNVRSDFFFKNTDTGTTLDDLLLRIRDRLAAPKNTAVINSAYLSRALNSRALDWLPVLRGFKKTMIACHNQKQAKQVADYFRAAEVDTALSISDTDGESSEVRRFQDEDDCLLLVVVGRGILGFNERRLENVIDMTGSRNIDRVFQLMSRAVRKRLDPGRDEPKLFVKIVPYTMTAYFSHVMTAALCLTTREWYETYDGTNSLDLRLPVTREPAKRRDSERHSGAPGRQPRHEIPQPVAYYEFPAIRLFKDLFHKDGATLHVYEWTTLGEVKDELRKHRTVEENVQQAEDLARENGGVLPAPSHQPPRMQDTIRKYPGNFDHIPMVRTIRKFLKRHKKE